MADLLSKLPPHTGSLDLLSHTTYPPLLRPLFLYRSVLADRKNVISVVILAWISVEAGGQYTEACIFHSSKVMREDFVLGQDITKTFDKTIEHYTLLGVKRMNDAVDSILSGDGMLQSQKVGSVRWNPGGTYEKVNTFEYIIRKIREHKCLSNSED